MTNRSKGAKVFVSTPVLGYMFRLSGWLKHGYRKQQSGCEGPGDLSMVKCEGPGPESADAQRCLRRKMARRHLHFRQISLAAVWHME